MDSAPTLADKILETLRFCGEPSESQARVDELLAGLGEEFAGLQKQFTLTLKELQTQHAQDKADHTVARDAAESYLAKLKKERDGLAKKNDALADALNDAKAVRWIWVVAGFVIGGTLGLLIGFT